MLAVAERGAMYDLSAVFYMEKLAVGPEAAGAVDIAAPVSDNIRRVAKAKEVGVADVTVTVLDRPRHRDLIAEIRRTGARIRFISDGDGRDLGGPAEHRRRHTRRHRRHARRKERRCAWRMGGEIQGKLWPQTDEERSRAWRPGSTWTRCSAPTTSCAATTCSSARPASPTATCSVACTIKGGCTTQSIVMRSKSGTVRMIDGYHRLTKPRSTGRWTST